MAEPTSCCAEPGGYCARVDTLFNLPGVHVLDVAWAEATVRRPPGLRLAVETDLEIVGCPDCGVVAERADAERGGCTTSPRSGRRCS